MQQTYRSHILDHLTAFACEADAPQALTTFAQGWQTTVLHHGIIHATPRDGTRGRPSQDAPPQRMDDHIEGALAASIPAREPQLVQQSGFMLATNELDNAQLPPRELLAGYQGQQHAQRGVRFLNDPRFLASSLDLKKTRAHHGAVAGDDGVLAGVYGTGIPHSQRPQGPQGDRSDQTGQAIQTPTARWVFHDFVGMHM